MEFLRKRPTYNEMVNYLENEQPKIKYPDRRASFLRNSPYLSQFDGDDSFIGLEEQENNIAKQRILEEEVKRLSAESKQTAQAVRYSRSVSGYTSPFAGSSVYDNVDTSMIDFLDDEDEEEERRNLHKRARESKIASLWYDMSQALYNQEMNPIPDNLRTIIHTPKSQPSQVSEAASLPALESVSEPDSLQRPSSSSVVMPTGINPVPLPTTTKRATRARSLPAVESRIEEGLTRGVKIEGRVKSDIMRLDKTQKIQQVRLRGFTINENLTVKQLDDIISKNIEMFLKK